MGRLKRTKKEIERDIEAQEKECCVCNIRKPFSEFYNYKNKSDGKNYRCKSCDNSARLKHKLKNPEHTHRKTRNRNLLSRFGITIEEYEEMFKQQGSKCAICGTKENQLTGHNAGYSFSVDHCHDTGKVRGILCSNCNRGIGLLGDKASSVYKAFKYLDKHKETH